MRVLVALALAASALAVDRSKFRTCNDAGFCRRHRSKAAEPEVGERAGACAAPRRADAHLRAPVRARALLYR
jgi:hypothetical protein